MNNSVDNKFKKNGFDIPNDLSLKEQIEIFNMASFDYFGFIPIVKYSI